MAEPVILLVDDDPQVLAALRRDMRSKYGAEYRVLGANSGQTAIDALKELKARADTLAMVISDQRMPSMLGVDVLKRTREIYPIARRVLLTAYSDIKAAVERSTKRTWIITWKNRGILRRNVSFLRLMIFWPHGMANTGRKLLA